jgi:hypothetical protein
VVQVALVILVGQEPTHHHPQRHCSRYHRLGQASRLQNNHRASIGDEGELFFSKDFYRSHDKCPARFGVKYKDTKLEVHPKPNL